MPVEWQPSFREFKRLCVELKEPIIYEPKNIINLWDTYKKINKNILFKKTESYANCRTKEITILWYYIDDKNITHNYKIDKTYSLLDIAMFAKYKRKMYCPDIEKYKKLREKRAY